MTTGTNKRTAPLASAAVLCVLILGRTPGAAAIGTPAGTTVTNTVSVSYVVNAVAGTASASSSFTVDRLINVTVTKLSDPSAAPGQMNVPMSFSVTNTGNAPQRYALQALSRPTNTLTMNNVRIYRDSNNSGSLDAGDLLYADASTFGDLATDASFTVMIVADTPAGAATGQTAAYDLVAATVDAGTLVLSVPTAGPNTAGVDTVFIDSAGSAAGDAARDGKHSAVGTYAVLSQASVVMSKTVSVRDQWGGSQPIPGATLRYAISVSVTGAGTAQNVVVSDPLPAGTVYIPATLRLNGTQLTDAADTDAGDVGATTPNAVTVRLGDMTSASTLQTIVFEVRIP